MTGAVGGAVSVSRYDVSASRSGPANGVGGHDRCARDRLEVAENLLRLESRADAGQVRPALAAHAVDGVADRAGVLLVHLAALLSIGVSGGIYQARHGGGPRSRRQCALHRQEDEADHGQRGEAATIGRSSGWR